MSDVVSYDVVGKTAVVTINRAAKLNALDEDVITGPVGVAMKTQRILRTSRSGPVYETTT